MIQFSDQEDLELIYCSYIIFKISFIIIIIIIIKIVLQALRPSKFLFTCNFWTTNVIAYTSTSLLRQFFPWNELVYFQALHYKYFMAAGLMASLSFRAMSQKRQETTAGWEYSDTDADTGCSSWRSKCPSCTLLQTLNNEVICRS